MTFSCLINGSRYPRDLARVADKERHISENYGVRLGHLEDLTLACGESRPMQELTHHLTLHPSDPAYNSLGGSRITSSSKASTKTTSQALTTSAGVSQPHWSQWKPANGYCQMKEAEDQAKVLWIKKDGLCSMCNRPA